MDKHTLRREMITRLRNLDENKKKRWMEKIEKSLYKQTEWKHAKTIGITISNSFELPTKDIIETAWDEQKYVAVPLCDPENRQMEFYVIRSLNDLQEGYAGLKEPMKVCEKVNQDMIDLLVVPGICFDKRLYRIGQGGGFYDRFLQAYQGSTISLAYGIQVLPDIPKEPFDIPVKKLITNESIYC